MFVKHPPHPIPTHTLHEQVMGLKQDNRRVLIAFLYLISFYYYFFFVCFDLLLLLLRLDSFLDLFRYFYIFQKCLPRFCHLLFICVDAFCFVWCWTSFSIWKWESICCCSTEYNIIYKLFTEILKYNKNKFLALLLFHVNPKKYASSDDKLYGEMHCVCGMCVHFIICIL